MTNAVTNSSISSIERRSFLALNDFGSSEIEMLLQLAAKLKHDKSTGEEQKMLEGKSIALIFEKDSMRTRIGFELAAADQGAHVTYLGPSGSKIGLKESIKDIARVLGRLYDGIEYRGSNQSDIEILAKHAGVPVFNGLTNEYHPTQVLADLLTIREHTDKDFRNSSLCYVGDAQSNVAHSLLTGCAIMGLDFRICSPLEFQPNRDHISRTRKIASDSGGKLLITESIDDALANVDFLYTDIWLSMEDPPGKWRERIDALQPYRVNAAMMRKTRNKNTKFMHCLPALHDCSTALAKKLYEKYGLEEFEVTNDVFESEQSIVFDQAENRMHTIKALLVSTLANRQELLLNQN